MQKSSSMQFDLGSYPWLSNVLEAKKGWLYALAVCTSGKNEAATFPSLWNRVLSASQKEEAGVLRGMVVAHAVYVKYADAILYHIEREM